LVEEDRRSLLWLSSPRAGRDFLPTMSDREGHSGGPDEDLSLPKATVAKMITGKLFQWSCIRSESLFAELLPADVVCSKDTRDLVIECCVGNNPFLLDLTQASILHNFVQNSFI
jgi:hypothetical protein